MQADLQTTQQDLMSAVIGHLGRLAQTGCPRASHRARLLIDHLGEGDTDQDGTSAMLRQLLEHLEPCPRR